VETDGPLQWNDRSGEPQARLPRVTFVAASKRTAPRRTAAAIAEDLLHARKSAGLWQATEADLAATLDCLSLTDGPASEKSLARARDLLASYVRRGCELHQKAHAGDKTSLAAAESLQTLLLRPAADTRLAVVIRREAAKAVNHAISADAVRHREDKIIDEIAEDVYADLQRRRGDEPQSIEAALHRLVPLVADVREDLHDGLCVIGDGVSPADARERRVIDGWYRQVVIKLGHLLVRSRQLARVGMQSPMTADEFWFVARARNLNASLFEGIEGDRAYMLEFIRTETTADYDESADKLLSTQRGQELYQRWVEWVQSCYPTCAFERATSLERMCSPHAFLTLLYAIETRYLKLGFRDLQLPESPIIHHGLWRMPRAMK
jgi:hypothetical protein